MAWDFATAATGAGLATTGITTAMSFAQAAQQNEKKRKADESAAAAMMEARKKLDVNYYEQLSIQKEPYELARRELLSQGALATQQLAEGDARALAAGVGRIQLAQQLGQEKVATAMQHEQTALEKLVAGEDSRLRDLGTQLDLQEVIGAQQAAADAEKAEALAMQQGFAGVTSLGQQVAQTAPLYAKKPEVKALNRIKRQAAKKGIDPNTLNLSDPASLKAAGINLTPNQIASLSTTGVKTVRDLEVFTKVGSFGAKAEQDYSKYLSGTSQLGQTLNTGGSSSLTPSNTGGASSLTPSKPAGVFLNSRPENGSLSNNQADLVKIIEQLATNQGVTTNELLSQFQNILPQDPAVNQGQSLNVPASSYGYGFNPINY